ncbi:B3 domain-containing protein At3g19184 isoform X2 [Malania oleifera]|uniref:B3 domain-containing protein At3g19184 isoform X2 n=1 Tax=Malania oleifera TaxID=397392 RepID=UPI0025AE298F|nr:B3 domain-containing protein At3g19184 isoform X2 [Malania oleifera]
MVVAKLTYEECRRKRLEENKKRMEDLNLTKLSQALLTPSPKASPMKQVKPRVVREQVVAVRRSGRVAKKPAPDYKEVSYDRLEMPRRIYKIHKRRDLSNRVYASDEARAHAIGRAEELQADLEPEYPNFLKPMLQSHVTGGFWLGLPAHFCKMNLPKREDIITLVDEAGDKYPTVFLARKAGLSGGWRGFSIDHELVDGDALVFQLIKPTVFKVYIIRVNSFKRDEQL